MSRITITNCKKKFEQDLLLNKEAGLTDYQVIETDNIFLAVYKKRIIKTENVLKFDNGDFVCAIGTIIYDELFEEEALKRMYMDFNGDIQKFREFSIGNYNICIKKEGVIHFFTDKYNFINSYYYNSNNNWFISNSLANVAIVKDKLKIDEFPLIEQCFFYDTIGNKTMFIDINRLYGNEQIKIDKNGANLKIDKIPYHIKKWDNTKKTNDEIVNDFKKNVSKNAKIIGSIFNENIRLQMTGGLDSRTVHAAFLNEGFKLKTMYGIGNSPLTNTKKKDLDFNKLFNKKYKTDLYLMDWKTDLKKDIKNWKVLFSKYGFQYFTYGGSKSIFAEYEGINDYPQLILTGDFGENLKLREWAQNKNKELFSAEEIVEEYFFEGQKLDKSCYSKFNSFTDYYKSILSIYSKMFGIDTTNGISLQEFDLFRQIHAKEADSYYMNMINEFSHSILFFGIPDLYEYPWSVSAELRRNQKFQMHLIKSLCPEYSNLPIYSHSTHKIISKDLSLTTVNVNIEKKGRIIINLIKKIPKLFDLLKNIYLSINQSKNGIIRKKMIRLINTDLYQYNILNHEKYKGDVRQLVTYTQCLYGIKWIFEKRNSNLHIFKKD